MAHDLDTVLNGISDFLLTPYDDEGDTAPAKLSPIIDHEIGAWVHLLVANGNTGEFYALTTDETYATAQHSKWYRSLTANGLFRPTGPT